MKKAAVKTVDVKPESDKIGDKAKRVYRAAVDIIRRLDEIGRQKRAFRDVFMPDAIHLRNSLQNYCERLMFYSPVEYGRKVEELLWRKVFYDVISLMKHNRKHMRPSSCLEGAFRTHLLAASGFYHHLIYKLQSEYGVKVEAVLDFYQQDHYKTYQRSHQQRVEPETAVREWALRATHRCLVYLGDIARYQQDYDGMQSKVLAQRYYYQAYMLCPDIGMPLNQLGTLADNRYYLIDAAYYYLRCVVSTQSFDGAHDNLTRLLDKNLRRYTELCVEEGSNRELPPDQQKWRKIKKFAVRFLHLIHQFFQKTKNNSSHLQDLCQSTLQEFQSVMFIQPPHRHDNEGLPGQQFANDDRPLCMEDELVFKIMVICMCTVHELQKAGEKQVAAGIAFSLALFSHVLNHTVIRLQSALCDLENTPLNSRLTPDEQSASTTDADRPPSKTPTDSHHKKKSHKKAWRSRRRYHSQHASSDDETHDLSDSNSDLSQGEDEHGDSGDDLLHHYLHHSPSSSSGSDSEDNLIISQELRPGFSLPAPVTTPANHMQELAEEAEEEEELDSKLANERERMFIDGGSPQVKRASTNHRKASKKSELKMSPNCGLDQNSSQVSSLNQLMGDFPHDWLSDATSFFSQSRRGVGGVMGGARDDNLQAVSQGKKDVPVPPGFEESTESQHVMEITEKMANFVIETDTDTSNFPTDTDHSTLTTESEMDTEREDTDVASDSDGGEERRSQHVMQVIENQGLLATVKVFCDWMKCNPHVIATCAKSCSSLWSRLAVLLNFLPQELHLANTEYCQSDSVLETVQVFSSHSLCTQSIALKEDLHLLAFPPLIEAHSGLSSTSQHLDDKQAAVLRVCYLRQFGHFITQLDNIEFSYQEDTAQFYGPTQNRPQSASDTQEDGEARRRQLMRDMAQLRLQAEVSQLEGSIQGGGTEGDLPPYLLPDAATLCSNLSLVKQLAATTRFIIIIPLTVIDHLDLLKKEKSGARDSIRWLEAELRTGSRFVRAQKANEKTGTLSQKNFKKKDWDAWRFMQIVDCGRYFSQQCVDGEGRGMVCILTNQEASHSDNMTSSKISHALSLATQEGILVQSVAVFHARWKEQCKNNKS